MDDPHAESLRPAVRHLIQIANSSFEVDPITGAAAPAFQARTTAPTGWTISGPPEHGLVAPDAGEPNARYDGVTRGQAGAKAYTNVLQSTTGLPALSQDLPANLAANTAYTLSMAIGHRSSGNWGGFRIAVETTGGTVVAEWVGGNRHFTNGNSFGRFSRKFTTGPNPPGLGQALRLVIRQPAIFQGNYLDIDDVALTADAVPGHAPGTPIEVFVVSGQSNSHGWNSPVANLGTGNRHYIDSPHPGSLLSYQQNNLGETLYSSGSFSEMSSQGPGFVGTFDGFGPEVALGNDLAGRLPGDRSAVIKFSVSGASLDNNFKKSANQLYPLLVARIRNGLQQLADQGYAPELKGFYWLQGESDALASGADAGDAAVYGINLTQFIADLRADLAAPRLKFFLTELNPNMPALSTSPGRILVNQHLQTAADNDPDVTFIPTADIVGGFADAIHYSADQTMLIGQRWANAYADPPPTRRRQRPGPRSSSACPRHSRRATRCSTYSTSRSTRTTATATFRPIPPTTGRRPSRSTAWPTTSN